jgi:hypothetical protein
MPVLHAVLDESPVLGGPRSPVHTASIGCLTGGIGPAIHFKSFRDLLSVEAAAGLAVIGLRVTDVNPVIIVGSAG